MLIALNAKKFKKLFKEAERENKLAKIPKKYKDPIKARNEVYLYGFFCFVALGLFLFTTLDFSLERIEIKQFYNNEFNELYEQNEILRKNVNSLIESNDQKNKLITESFSYFTCDELKEILPSEKWDRYDYEIEHIILSRCI